MTNHQICLPIVTPSRSRHSAAVDELWFVFRRPSENTFASATNKIHHNVVCISLCKFPAIAVLCKRGKPA